MNTDLTPAPTPRTDAEILTWMTFPETPQMMPPVVTSIFARGLERELLTASKERDSAIEELVEAKQAWLDKSDAERGPYVAFETYDSVCRALREEQLKTQALTADLIVCRQISDNHECAMRAMDAVYYREKARLDWLDRHCAFVADSEFNIGPYKVGELRNMADDGIKQSAALAGEQPTRP